MIAKMKMRCLNMKKFLEKNTWGNLTRRSIMWARSSFCHYVNSFPSVFKSPITSFEANCACQPWITPTVEMMKVLTITKEFIQEVEALS